MIYWNTVSPLLKRVLEDLMTEPLFNNFNLVGGTALSLQIGHRMSVDIDLFTNSEYGSIDFKNLRSFFENKYPFCDSRNLDNVAFGTYFIVGNSKDDCIKVDLYYTDNFVYDLIVIENIRMVSQKEIIAMKLEVIINIDRKKDFWDLHFFLSHFSIDEMILFYELRYPYNDSSKIKKKLIYFENAEKETDPNCLLNKSWDNIKLDFIEKLQSTNLS